MTTYIIIALSLIIVFLIVFIVYLLRNTHVLNGWDNYDMIEFAQSVTNHEVTVHDLEQWLTEKDYGQVFSKN